MLDTALDFLPPVIAHRGARMWAPENTLPAFEAARADGAVWIEGDIKLTLDGVPILMHDDRLERTTDGAGLVADMTWEDIQKLDTGSWFAPQFKNTRVLSLAELLAFARPTGMRLNLELKPCPGRTQATAMVALIEAAKLWPVTAPVPLISSFDIEALIIAAQLHPDWPRGLLLDEWREDWRELAALTRATTINLNVDLLTPDRLPALLKSGMPILAYTVNDVAQARDLLRQGVRAVFSDDPAAMVRL